MENVKATQPTGEYVETKDMTKDIPKSDEKQQFEIDTTKAKNVDLAPIKQEINPQDMNSIVNYGAKQQEKLSDFSNRMLANIQNEKTEPIEKEIDALMKQLKGFDPDELIEGKNKSLIKRLFESGENQLKNILRKNYTISERVTRISNDLEKGRTDLLRDTEFLEELFHHNQDYYDEITHYIDAAREERERLSNEVLPQMEKESTDDAKLQQKTADMHQFIERLDKRISDLEISRNITVQTAPQIRMIQNSNQALAERISSSINTSIPVWQNQMAVAMTLARQKKLTESHKRIAETTNKIMRENADNLNKNATEIARQNEEPLVTVETLRYTHQKTKDTINRVLKQTQEGASKRQAAREEIEKIERDAQSTSH